MSLLQARSLRSRRLTPASMNHAPNNITQRKLRSHGKMQYAPASSRQSGKLLLPKQICSIEKIDHHCPHPGHQFSRPTISPRSVLKIWSLSPPGYTVPLAYWLLAAVALRKIVFRFRGWETGVPCRCVVDFAQDVQSALCGR